MRYWSFLAAAAAMLAPAGAAQAQDVKIGLILPMTGQQQSTGKQEAAAAKLYMAQHGDTVAGKKVELIIKDDGADGDSLIAAAKGVAWESPRGPVSIDPETRDIVQNVYIRKVEKKNGELYNVEFATFANVKDPIKAAEVK